MKILLLNPPGEGFHLLRDYYCPGIAKANYYYHPVDLLYLSGTLAQEHDVHVLDAVARRLTFEEATARIVALAPEAVISLTSAPTFIADDTFLRLLHAKLPTCRIIATGDVFRERRENMFELQPYLEACLVDFSTQDMLTYLRGAHGETIENVAYRHEGRVVAGPEVHHQGEFSIPQPLWAEFPAGLYSLPIAKREPFMTVLTDFGCAYHCIFCPMSTINHKVRPVAEVMDELKALVKLGYREIHFRDQTFGVDTARTLQLCARIAEELPGLVWTCFSRVDVLDEERARAMRRAGCHTVILGIEFAQDLLYTLMKKHITRAQLFQTVGICRRVGLRTAGEFIIGLPDQTAEETLATGELAVQLGLDFAAFNLAMPRMATPWRAELIAAGKTHADEWRADTVRGSHAWTDAKIPRDELLLLRRRIERRFYLRPAYILRQLSGIRTWTEVKMYAHNGLSILLGST